jgi:hypothetical protein
MSATMTKPKRFHMTAAQRRAYAEQLEAHRQQRERERHERQRACELHDKRMKLAQRLIASAAPLLPEPFGRVEAAIGAFLDTSTEANLVNALTQFQSEANYVRDLVGGIVSGCDAKARELIDTDPHRANRWSEVAHALASLACWD